MQDDLNPSDFEDTARAVVDSCASAPDVATRARLLAEAGLLSVTAPEAVGGLDLRGPAGAEHYPLTGYDEPHLVDVWAQAMGVNRAALRLAADAPACRAADGDGLARVWAADTPEETPTGTSYAAPQVAAAAALWLVLHRDRLETAFAAERWRIVESFRAALRASARPVKARLLGPGRLRTRRVRALDLPALLRTKPPEEGLTRAPEAARHVWA